MLKGATTSSSSNSSDLCGTNPILGNDSCSLLVSLPLLVSYGGVVKQDSSASAVYVFPSEYPSARALFARSLDICDMFVGQLQVDLVSFCCKRSQVAQVASVFTRMARKKLDLQFSRPIYIRCEGLKQRAVSSSPSTGGAPPTHDIFTGGGQQRVYFTSVDVLTDEDREKFWAVESFVETYVDKLKELKLVNAKSVARTPDLFVVVRRFLSDPPLHPLSHYSQYVCEGVQLSEVRLVFSKGTSQCPVKHLKVDPRFRANEISCRPIVCDSDGRPARQEFSQSFLPRVFPTSSAAVTFLTSQCPDCDDGRQTSNTTDGASESDFHLIGSSGVCKEDSDQRQSSWSSVASPLSTLVPSQQMNLDPLPSPRENGVDTFSSTAQRVTSSPAGGCTNNISLYPGLAGSSAASVTATRRRRSKRHDSPVKNDGNKFSIQGTSSPERTTTSSNSAFVSQEGNTADTGDEDNGHSVTSLSIKSKDENDSLHIAELVS